VTIEKHSASPFALSACENAFIEEQHAKEREAEKRQRTEEFHNSTRIMLLAKMEEIEKEKQRSNYETAEKIKKLLADTVEFSQRTALAAKRGKSQESVFSEDRDEVVNERSSNRGSHVIRNLIGTPNDKKHPDPKGASGQ